MFAFICNQLGLICECYFERAFSSLLGFSVPRYFGFWVLVCSQIFFTSVKSFFDKSLKVAFEWSFTWVVSLEITSSKVSFDYGF